MKKNADIYLNHNEILFTFVLNLFDINPFLLEKIFFKVIYFLLGKGMAFHLFLSSGWFMWGLAEQSTFVSPFGRIKELQVAFIYLFIIVSHVYVEGKTVCFLHACCFYFYLFVVDFLAIYTKRQVILLHVMSSVLYKSMLCDKVCWYWTSASRIYSKVVNVF